MNNYLLDMFQQTADGMRIPTVQELQSDRRCPAGLNPLLLDLYVYKLTEEQDWTVTITPPQHVDFIDLAFKVVPPKSNTP